MVMMIILFLLLKTQILNVPVVTSSVRENQKLTKLLSKGCERSVY